MWMTLRFVYESSNRDTTWTVTYRDIFASFGEIQKYNQFLTASMLGYWVIWCWGMAVLGRAREVYYND